MRQARCLCAESSHASSLISVPGFYGGPPLVVFAFRRCMTCIISCDIHCIEADGRRAQGRTFMRDFLVKAGQTKNPDVLQDVLYWLRDAGAELRRMQAAGRPLTPQPEPDTDEAEVEFFKTGWPKR